MVAQQLGIAHPHVVRSLALLNTLPGVWPPTREIVRVGLTRFRPGAAPSMEEIASSVAQSLFPGKEDAHAAPHDRAAPRGQRSGGLPPGDAGRGAVPARQRTCERSRCPVLIVAGDSDRVVPGEYQARLRAGIPHAEFVTVCGGGHACNIDYADEVNAAVLAFLERQA